MSTSGMQSRDYRSLLREALEQFRSHNPAFSLRAFAKKVETSPSFLCEILAGREKLSPKRAAHIAQRLGFGRQRTQLLLDLVRLERVRDAGEQKVIEERVEKAGEMRGDPHLIDLDSFRFISDWHHLGILSALEIRRLRGNIRKIAAYLGIGAKEGEEAAARLQRLGLVAVKGEKLTATHGITRTADGVPSAAIRSFHRQILAKVTQQLDSLPPQARFINSSILAVKASQLQEAKEVLNRFRDEFAARFACQDESDAVFSLSLSYFPIAKSE